MLMSFSVSRGVFLLSLAAVMFVTGSEGMDKMKCCSSVTNNPITDTIVNCYEQTVEWGCQLHAYVVVTIKNEGICVAPNAPWFMDHIKKKDCAPVINVKPPTELDEEDFE